MKKSHKFLILEDYYGENVDVVRHDQAVVDRIHAVDYPEIRLIECAHEKFEDNCVDLFNTPLLGDTDNFQSYVKDIHGRLFYWQEVHSKEDLVAYFE